MDTPSRYEFLVDPQLLGRPRAQVSLAQRTALKTFDGEPLTPEELETYHACTGRERYPGVPFPEMTMIAGARSGKDSVIAAPSVLYEAVFAGHERHLTRGEHGTCVLVAQDQRATRVAYSYIRAYATGSPLVRRLVEEEREAELRFSNGMRIVCFASTAKSIRGFSIPAAVMDEMAFFRLESGADADVEIQTAIRRGGVGFPAPRLIKITTPYLRTGVVFDDFTRYWGQDDPDVLVWRAATSLMNPSIDGKRLAREQRVDGQRFAREYLAEFGEDLEAFLPGVWIEAATADGVHERPPDLARTYRAAVDPSGGAVKGDAFTLAIAHIEGARIVQDVMKAWASSRGATVDLGQVCAEIAATCRRYGVHSVKGDHYAGQWPEQEFRKVGIHYTPTEHDKSQTYRELEPQLAQGRVDLLDHPTMLRELRLLERRYKPGGKTPTIDHPKGGHDDCANALAIVVADWAGSMHAAVDIGADALGRLHDPTADVAIAPAAHAGFWGRVPPGVLERRPSADAGARPYRGGFWR